MTINYIQPLPIPTHDPSVDVGNMATNTDSIAAYVAVDHVGFGVTGLANGTHKQVTFSNVSSPSTPTDPASILYTKNDSASHPQLFFLNNQNAAFNVASETGSVVLLGGIILQWGVGSAAPVTGAPNTLAIPFPNNFFSVTITVRSVAGGEYSTSAIITDLQHFTATCSTSPQNCYYLAIGN